MSPITKKGFEQLEQELNHLKNTIRNQIIEEISTARDHGDLSENAEYHAAREKQSFNEGRIKELESILAQAEIIDSSSIESNQIVFGATVKIEDLDNDSITKEYQIVSNYEANIDNNLISYQSPLGKELIGKKIGDIVDIITPKGEKSWEIKSIKYV